MAFTQVRTCCTCWSVPKTTAPTLAELDRRMRALEKDVATILAELRTRDVLPAAAPVSRRARAVKMDPATRKAQRQRLLAEARKQRWKADAEKGKKTRV